MPRRDEVRVLREAMRSMASELHITDLDHVADTAENLDRFEKAFGTSAQRHEGD